MESEQKKAILVMIDGLGFSARWSGNVLAMKQNSQLNRMIKEYPSYLLRTLIDNQYDSAPDICRANVSTSQKNISRKEVLDSLVKGEHFDSRALRELVSGMRENGTACHLIGTIDDQEYFSSLNHIVGVLKFLKSNSITNVFLHLILAGDDQNKRAGSFLIGRVSKHLKDLGIGEIASLCGSDYLVSSDSQSREMEVFRNIALGKGERILDVEAAVANYYKGGTFDKSIPPLSVFRRDKPIGAINDFDGVIFFDFNSFFSKKIKFAISAKSMSKPLKISHLDVVSIIESDSLDSSISKISFTHPSNEPNLSHILSEHGLSQLFISEMVSSYATNSGFSGYRSSPYPGCKWQIAPSVNESEYASKPALSATTICDLAVQALNKASSDFILCDFCNLEIFSQYSSISLASQAFSFIDTCLLEIEKAASANNYTLFISSDRGGAEEIKTTQKSGYYNYSLNPVPFIIADKNFRNNSVRGNFADMLNIQYSVYDIAPTLLKFFNIEQPDNFVGESLIV